MLLEILKDCQFAGLALLVTYKDEIYYSGHNADKAFEAMNISLDTCLRICDNGEVIGTIDRELKSPQGWFKNYALLR